MSIIPRERQLIVILEDVVQGPEKSGLNLIISVPLASAATVMDVQSHVHTIDEDNCNLNV